MRGNLTMIKIGWIGMVLFCISISGNSQADLNLSVNKQFGVQVRLEGDVFKHVSQADLKDARTLSDINDGFPASWIESYISVDVNILNNGQVHSASSSAHELSKDQLALICKADYGSTVEVEVRYIPNNSLKANEEKNINFALVVTPQEPAEFVGGFQPMRNYLMENTIDKIPYSQLYKLEAGTIHFTIDENGKAINARLSQSTTDDNADQLIMNAIHSMPAWKPAETADGTRVSQNFVFFMGDQIGC